MQTHISRRRLSEHSKGRVDHSIQDPASTPPKPSMMLMSSQSGVAGDNWAQAVDSGSHWGHPDLRGKTEGRKPLASGFPTVEGHRLLATEVKVQRGQEIQLRSP